MFEAAPALFLHKCAKFQQVCGLNLAHIYALKMACVDGWMDELGVWKVLAQPSSSLAGKMSHVQNVDPALKFYK